MKFFLKLIIFGVIFSFGSYLYYNYNIKNPIDENDSNKISIIVKPGEPITKITENLKENGLIRNKYIFKLYITQNKLDKNIKSGRFLLSKDMNIPTIIEKLSSNSEGETILTIQEGLTIREINQKLKELELINDKEFLDALNNFSNWERYSFLSKEANTSLPYKLEGFIYPDTYFVSSVDFKPENLIQIALNNFEKKLATLDLESSPIYKKYSLQEIITMASIVENEVFGKEDRHLVAGIFWKRLENNWTLGADITLIYEKGGDRSITATDIQQDSPYNTRKNLGLPPGPISNPSIESINAVLYPKESPYWFYLTTLDTGRVIYAETNDEHNANRYKYL